MIVELETKHLPKGMYEVKLYLYQVRGETALTIWQGDLPQMTATVLLEDHPTPDERHVWIKSWMENEGLMQALIDAGVIRSAKAVQPINRVIATLHELTAPAVEAFFGERQTPPPNR